MNVIIEQITIYDAFHFDWPPNIVTVRDMNIPQNTSPPTHPVRVINPQLTTKAAIAQNNNSLFSLPF